MKTLQDWLNYLEVLHPKTIDLGLERVTQVAKRLGLYPWPSFCITVAGTNGKGSNVVLLEQILLHAGLRVGAYFSPHLIHYNERIHINGHEVSDQALCAAFEKIDVVRKEHSLSYFEFGTLAALLLFKEAQLDIVVLEVGLGGRLDAVNCIDNDISVITSIDLDHCDYLGDTREAIAQEKAGIFRKGRPVVCGDLVPPTNLQGIAMSLAAPFYQQNTDFGFIKNDQDWSFWHSLGRLNNLPLPQLLLQNAATSLQVIHLLPDSFPITRSAIDQGLRSAKLLGRLDYYDKDGITIILDVSHNPAAAKLLAAHLQENPVIGKTYCVFAMLKDKDIDNSIKPLADSIDYWHIAGLSGERGSQSSELLNHMQKHSITQTRTFSDVVEAFEASLAIAGPGDRVVIYGSFHTIGPILEKIRYNTAFTR